MGRNDRHVHVMSSLSTGKPLAIGANEGSGSGGPVGENPPFDPTLTFWEAGTEIMRLFHWVAAVVSPCCVRRAFHKQQVR